jgi:hypothetical protein
MFVDGLDFVGDRNDTVTDPVVSAVVQDVLDANGASATGVAFGLTASTFLPSYQLQPGELAKLGAVSYV